MSKEVLMIPARSSRAIAFGFASLIAGVSALSLASCGDGDAAGGVAAVCSPFSNDACMMPWPSMAYLDPDPTSATGFRVNIPASATPANGDHISVDPTPLDRWDGFSPSGPILVRFPGGVSATGLPGWANPDDSLAADAPIVLIDVNSGERKPFFAEVDMNVTDPTERTLIIRPLVRLKEKTRYAVAIRNTVLSADGVTPLTPNPEFAKLLAGRTITHPRGAQTTAGFANMFISLEAAGVHRDELVLAWDFVTASDEFLTSDMRTMTSAALTANGDGSGITFQPQELTGTSSLHQYIGTFDSPNFLTANEDNDSVIVRAPVTGLPVLTGTHPARFAAIVPQCVTTEPLPRPTIVFGHGLFGSAQSYLTDAFVQSIAEQYCFIIVAGDFIGLTERQLGLAPLAANDLNKAYWVSEKLEQSVVDFITLEIATRTVFKDSPLFAVNGTSVIDPDRTFYVGGSLGGIMGNTFMAYDPNIKRGVLAVLGGVWSMLFERSAAWTLLQGAEQGSYFNPADQQMLISFFGMAMEPVDPITTSAHVVLNPFPGVPQKQILAWEAVDDALVNNNTTEMVVRQLGLNLVGPSVKHVWGLNEVDGEMISGFTVLNDDPHPKPTGFNTPINDNGTHSGINNKPSVLRALEAFVLGGIVVDACEIDGTPAPCDCAHSTACN